MLPADIGNFEQYMFAALRPIKVLSPLSNNFFAYFMWLLLFTMVFSLHYA